MRRFPCFPCFPVSTSAEVRRWPGRTHPRAFGVVGPSLWIEEVNDRIDESGRHLRSGVIAGQSQGSTVG